MQQPQDDARELQMMPPPLAAQQAMQARSGQSDEAMIQAIDDWEATDSYQSFRNLRKKVMWVAIGTGACIFSMGMLNYVFQIETQMEIVRLFDQATKGRGHDGTDPDTPSGMPIRIFFAGIPMLAIGLLMGCCVPAYGYFGAKWIHQSLLCMFCTCSGISACCGMIGIFMCFFIIGAAIPGVDHWVAVCDPTAACCFNNGKYVCDKETGLPLAEHRSEYLDCILGAQDNYNPHYTNFPHLQKGRCEPAVKILLHCGKDFGMDHEQLEHELDDFKSHFPNQQWGRPNHYPRLLTEGANGELELGDEPEEKRMLRELFALEQKRDLQSFNKMHFVEPFGKDGIQKFANGTHHELPHSLHRAQEDIGDVLARVHAPSIPNQMPEHTKVDHKQVDHVISGHMPDHLPKDIPQDLKDEIQKHEGKRVKLPHDLHDIRKIPHVVPKPPPEIADNDIVNDIMSWADKQKQKVHKDDQKDLENTLADMFGGAKMPSQIPNRLPGGGHMGRLPDSIKLPSEVRIPEDTRDFPSEVPEDAPAKLSKLLGSLFGNPDPKEVDPRRNHDLVNSWNNLASGDDARSRAEIDRIFRGGERLFHEVAVPKKHPNKSAFTFDTCEVNDKAVKIFGIVHKNIDELIPKAEFLVAVKLITSIPLMILSILSTIWGFRLWYRAQSGYRPTFLAQSMQTPLVGMQVGAPIAGQEYHVNYPVQDPQAQPNSGAQMA